MEPQPGERAFVFVIEEATGGEGLVARRRNVELGRRIPGWAEILSGIEPGEKMIGDGIIGVTDGSPLEVVGGFEEPSEPFNPRTRD